MWKSRIKLDEFSIGQSLGQGMVGEIYSAVEISTQKTVALKILQLGYSQDKMIRSRFEREIVILERLRHPNIIEVYGGGETQGRLFYAMEYVDAGSGRDLLQQYGRLPWMEVAAIAKQVSSALQYAHNHGIIHRDLKPGNLFLTKEGNVKLGDFGIARDTRLSNLTEQGLTVGTHAYMAPEQITASAKLSGKSDLYSLGCVLYELLVGHPPFVVENIVQLFESHLHKTAPRVSESIPDIPKEFDDIVAQLLEKNPDDRPFNARSVQGVMIGLIEQGTIEDCNTRIEAGETIEPQPDETNASSAPETCRVDIGADSIVDLGQMQLSHRLQGRLTSEAFQSKMITAIAISALAIVAIYFWFLQH